MSSASASVSRSGRVENSVKDDEKKKEQSLRGSASQGLSTNQPERLYALSGASSTKTTAAGQASCTVS